MRLPAFTAVAAFTLLLSGCFATTSGTREPAVDTQPMYGGMDRSSVPALRAADDAFIRDVSARFGSRERASKLWVGQGYRFYQQDDLDTAMKRFNQAWLLDPRNPEVFTGFGAVLHDRQQYCEAMRVMQQALTLNPPSFQGIYPDTARVTVLCAVKDEALAPEARAQLLQQSEQLYKQALSLEPNKGYVYASWATAYYWRAQYSDAWKMVSKARAAGTVPGKKFIDMLQAKMPEPRS